MKNIRFSEGENIVEKAKKQSENTKDILESSSTDIGGSFTRDEMNERR